MPQSPVSAVSQVILFDLPFSRVIICQWSDSLFPLPLQRLVFSHIPTRCWLAFKLNGDFDFNEFWGFYWFCLKSKIVSFKFYFRAAENIHFSESDSLTRGRGVFARDVIKGKFKYRNLFWLWLGFRTHPEIRCFTAANKSYRRKNKMVPLTLHTSH